MMHRLLRGTILVAMAVVAILLCLDLAYLVSGSLEQMPTPEQEDKVRIVTSVIAIMLLAVEAALWFIHRSLTRNAGGSSDAADRGR
jgi:hypothetical protein